jgi:putative ATP-binding cassette transporter
MRGALYKSICSLNKIIWIKTIILLVLFNCWSYCTFSQEKENNISAGLEKEIKELMTGGAIPGMSLVIIKGGRQMIKTYGYADVENKVPVTSKTLFQIGSCSKAFTALAVAKLSATGNLNTSSFVSDYIPWLTFTFKEIPVNVTIEQLLHHTSGIPWNTISLIPESKEENALETTIRKIAGIGLNSKPGKEYEYATVNYDILALIVEKVTKQRFEAYLQSAVFDPLKLEFTSIGTPLNSSLMASGYKPGFFKARKYTAPVYRGNNAAGYVITNALDIGKWLSFQMGQADTGMYSLAGLTHMRDETVPLHGMSSYAMGWNISLSGNGEIYHDGLNPNFSAFIAFRPASGTGIAILTNCSSNSTAFIGEHIMKRLANEDIKAEHAPDNELDRVFSLISFIFLFFIFITIGFFVVAGIRRGRRIYAGFTEKTGKKFLSALGLIIPFLAGIYLFPRAYAGFDWEAMFVWTPYSFGVMILLILLSLFLSYCIYFVTLLFPEGNKYKRILPRVLLFSLLSGISNMLLIMLITNSIYSDAKVGYLLFYYILILLIYLPGRWFVESSLVRLTRSMTYELRMELIGKIFSTSYQRFEQIDRGRIYTTLTNDITTISESLNTITSLITSCFTAIGAFLYLGSIAFWATFLTIGLILSISAVYFTVSRKTKKYFEEARDTENGFMKLLNNLIAGFKEVSLHHIKKKEYQADVSDIALDNKRKMTFARLRFINAFLVGESLLVILLGIVALGLPAMFESIQTQTIMSFIIVLLYLIGPVNNILTSIPAVMQLKIARKRVLGFINDIPSDDHYKDRVKEELVSNVTVFRLEGIKYAYRRNNEESWFTVGPVNIEIQKGEIIFITGGNGSGKTTLAKLMTGLYRADEGACYINELKVDFTQLGEYFSAVFAPPVVFRKLYNINTVDQSGKINEYLKLLHLDQKVKVENGEYSTLALSTGQLKRLALLQCFLENNPIYLFDEWAADQDPEYRSFFYKKLLPDLKAQGKIIIAITHDDRYFYVADKILKMENGQLTIRNPELEEWER